MRLTPGSLCTICHAPQFNTPSGITCPNGHGGAEGYVVNEHPADPYEEGENLKKIEEDLRLIASPLVRATIVKAAGPNAIIVALLDTCIERGAMTDGPFRKHLGDQWEKIWLLAKQIEALLELQSRNEPL